MEKLNYSKLLIIGNGFDLASGLKSTFHNYVGQYNDIDKLTTFEKENELKWKNINNALSEFEDQYTNFIDKSSEKSKTFLVFQNDIIPEIFHIIRYSLDNADTEEKVSGIKPYYEANESINNVIEYLEEEFENLDDTIFKSREKISELSMIDYLILNNSKICNWTDVEQMVKDFLTKSYSESNYLDTFLVGISEFIKIIKICIDNPTHLDPKYPLELDYNDFHKKYCPKHKWIFGKYTEVILLMIKFWGFNILKDDPMEFFYKQLNKFEKKFAKYIYDDETSNNMDKESGNSYASKSSKILNELAGEYFPYNYSLLNFNYTFPNVAKQKNVENNLSSVKEQFMTLDEYENCDRIRNIHGISHLKNIIIGIDGNDVSNEYYKFTKTFRIMENASKKEETSKILSDNIKEVTFFGHSLGDADYSYFQSIFDYLDIYSNDITLNFSYFIYDTKKKAEIMKNRMNEVFHLINKYGISLNNKSKGKNLLHKILLENRIKFKEVNK